MTGSVVVGFDGSPESLAATEWAAREAERRGLRLDVLQAWPWPKRDVVGSDQSHRHALARLTGREAELRALVTGLEVAGCAVSADPVEALEEAARSAAVLVLGSRGLGTLRGFLVGSVSQEVLRRAVCPVVLVRAEAGEAAGPVTVGLDLARPADPVLAFAFEAAALRSAPLRVVHVWSPPAGTEHLSYGAIGGLEGEVSAHERADLSEALESWRARHPEVQVTADLVRGKAAVELVDAAATARLLVVGRRLHHRMPLLHHHLGPVAHAAIHHAHCPVAVVPYG
ncbi:universal stress protein [Streptomyces sp. 1331.2]|uniref:universal stress protein n=1 Tax=Streptomyces sp. 1331.2 TaxID=1938835 RepID=UPI000BC67C2E|nr:universal stress protein [Streptomyces sp. 1331.2]SOB86292.1 Nucleotide-binding universal stress protein, UspA family [Streptomyces sp. 1331.2]